MNLRKILLTLVCTGLFSGLYANTLPTGDIDNDNKPKTVKSNTEEFVTAHGIELVADQEENLGMVYGPWYKNIIKNLPANIVLVDIRTKEKFETGHIPGAINAPFDLNKSKEFVADITKLGKTVIMNCKAGAVSTEAMMEVEKHGGDLTKIFYVDANIKCNAKHECTIEINDPI